MSTMLLIALGLMVAAACRVDTSVTVDVDTDGSGVVEITVVADRAAAELLGDHGTALRMDDLVESGWTIEDPLVDDDSGELRLSASRGFDSGEELARILATVGVGEDGGSVSSVPFISDVVLGITDTPGRIEYDLRGVLRIPAGLEALSDPALVEVLDGLPVGRTPEELEAMGYDPARGIGDLMIRVHLPGEVATTTGRIDGRYVEWSAPLGSTEIVEREVRQKNVVVDRGPARLRAVALIALVGAAALGVVGLVRRH